MKLDHCLTLYIKINSILIKDMIIRPETIKLLEENIGSKHLDISFVITSLTWHQNKGKGSKLKQMGLHQSFCTAKETMNEIKRQPTEWEKVLENHISDEGLKFKIYWLEYLHPMFTAPLLTTARTGKPPKCPSVDE